MENSMKEVALTGTSFTPEEVYEDGYILRVVFTEKENKNKPLGNGEGSCQYRQLPFLDFHMTLTCYNKCSNSFVCDRRITFSI